MASSHKAEKIKNSEPVEAKPIKAPEIMTKPLPQILAELEDYIGRVEEAVRQAKIAAKESREAAARAKEAGEKAAAEAAAKAEKAVTRDLVRRIVSSWEFLLIVGAVVLGSVYASIAISVGLSGLR
jgi:hypothetical protein